MTARARGIGSQIAAGVAWMVLMRLAIRMLGFVSTIVLARLLTPADYGVIALAMIFVGLLDAFTAFGFDVVLIQDQEAPPEKYHCVWTLTVIRGVTLAAVTFLAAPLCADFFAEPALSRVLQLLALATLVGAFENTATVDFRKNLQFDREFRLMVYPKVIGFVVTVALAVAWRDYWALAVGMVVTRLIAVITGYVMRPYRPVPCLEHWAEIFRFSKWLMANSILRYGYNNSESMVLGKLMGSAAVGAYAIANEIAMMVSSELVAPIQRAILPGYAKLARSENGLRDAYLAVLGVTNVVGLPVSAGIALTADLFVPLLLGDKWAQTIPLIQILSVAVVLRLGLANSGTVYVVSGKPWLTTLLSVISLAGGVPLIMWGVMSAGAVGAAVGATGMIGLFAACNAYVISRLLALERGAILAAIIRPLLASVAMVIAVVAARDAIVFAGLGVSAALLAELVCTIVIGAGVYAGTLLALWHARGYPAGAESRLLGLLRERLPARFARIGM